MNTLCFPIFQSPEVEPLLKTQPQDPTFNFPSKQALTTFTYDTNFNFTFSIPTLLLSLLFHITQC